MMMVMIMTIIIMMMVMTCDDNDDGDDDDDDDDDVDDDRHGDGAKFMCLNSRFHQLCTRFNLISCHVEHHNAKSAA